MPAKVCNLFLSTKLIDKKPDSSGLITKKIKVVANRKGNEKEKFIKFSLKINHNN